MKMDTFSFGVVLLELLTALPTFDPNREGRDLVRIRYNYFRIIFFLLLTR